MTVYAFTLIFTVCILPVLSFTVNYTHKTFYCSVFGASTILFWSGSHGLPLEADRGLCRGWCTRWCPRAAGQGDESLMGPSAHCLPLPKETSRGRRRWRWTAPGWTQPLQSLCTCHTRQNSFPVWKGQRWHHYLTPPRSLIKIIVHLYG